jgi:hypothetical protein
LHTYFFAFLAGGCSEEIDAKRIEAEGGEEGEGGEGGEGGDASRGGILAVLETVDIFCGASPVHTKRKFFLSSGCLRRKLVVTTLKPHEDG